jgi:phosphoribosyl 1,2-cyclic phosphate phosphodiesterase
MDHVQGLFEWRWGKNQQIDVIGPEDPDGCADLFKHPGIFDFGTKAEAFVDFELGPFRITPLPLNHSKPTLGYLIERGGKRIAYLCDTVGLPQEVTEFLGSTWLDIVIVDCSAPPQKQRPTHHNDLRLALEIHASLRCDQTILTHIDHELDLWLPDNLNYLPNNVKVGHDGMTVSL